MSLSREQAFAKVQQSPYETHLNSPDPDFYLDLHQMAHTHKLFSDKLVKMSKDAVLGD